MSLKIINCIEIITFGWESAYILITPDGISGRKYINSSIKEKSKISSYFQPWSAGSVFYLHRNTMMR